MFGPFGPFGMRFDWPEFMVGLVVGIVAGLILSRFLPAIPWARDWAQSKIRIFRENALAGARDRYYPEVVKQAETQHIARAIFALNEVLIPPRLLAPPIPTDPLQTEPVPQDSLAVLPNLPDFTYLSGIYRAHSISLESAIEQGANFMITGEPGSGKSTALAYVASRLGQGGEGFGEAASKLPVLISILDLQLDREWEEDALDPLIAVVQRMASPGLAPRIPRYLQLHFAQGSAILLMDDLDALGPEEVDEVTPWLETLVAQYPDLQIVAAGPTRGYDGLVLAGLFPVVIAPWTDHEQRQFLDRWAAAWQQHVVPLLPEDPLRDLDPTLINGWLVGSLRGLSPLDLTLRVWSAYAGDALGSERSDNLIAYVDRFLSMNEAQSARSVAKVWSEEQRGALRERSLPVGTPVSDLAEAGILVRRMGNRVSFFQPAIGAFLAAQAMAETELSDKAIPSRWDFSNAVLTFYAGMADITPLVDGQLEIQGDPTELPVLTAGLWLRDAGSDAEWRSKALRSLGKILHDPNRAYGLRLRAVHALVGSGESQIAALFQRLLNSEARSSRILASIGLGGIRDEDSVEKLITMVGEDTDLNVRQAACLALAAIGNGRALEGLGSALLEGEEPVRLAAAEALAIHPDEGYGMLREAIEFDDLLTRRAAVFGLLRIPEEWATRLLEHVRLEDKQWVVRGAASEALERRTTPHWRIPSAGKELSELPWLVAFAAREGLGVAPGKAAFEMLRRALSSGVLDEQLAALEAVGWFAAGEFGLELYQALNGSEVALRDAAYEAFWRLSAAGVELPKAEEFGLVPATQE